MSDQEVSVVEDVAHSKLGASSAYRWMNCAGSVRLSKAIVDSLPDTEKANFDKSGYPAAEGTAAHYIMAKAAEKECDAWEYLGEKVAVDGYEIEVDQDMVDGVQVHLDLIRKLMDEYSEYGARLYIEVSLSSFLDSEAFGTSDTIIFVPGIKIIVIDLKYGFGVVEPDSLQNHYYGYLACENFESEGIEDVELWIVQPRVPHPKGRARKHDTTQHYLEDWFTNKAIPAMAATRDPEALLTIGDWCRYCPARDHCPALKSEVSNFDMSLEPEYLTDDELGEVLGKKDPIIQYFNKLDVEAFKRARRGAHVPGRKLVRKKANRVFRESITEIDKETGEKKVLKLEDALKLKFGKDAYEEPKLKTPPKIEEIPEGRKFVSRWAYTPDAGLTLAPESDKREAVKLTGDEFFGDVDF